MKLKQIKLTKKNYTRTVRVTRNQIGYLKTADKFEFKSRDLVQGSKQLIKVHNSSKTLIYYKTHKWTVTICGAS